MRKYEYKLSSHERITAIIDNMEVKILHQKRNTPKSNWCSVEEIVTISYKSALWGREVEQIE